MREAALVLEEATKRESFLSDGWSPVSLREWAKEFEREDKAKAEQKALAEEMAQTLWRHDYPTFPWIEGSEAGRAHRLQMAHTLLKSYDITPKAK